MEYLGVVYLWTNNVTNKSYVGITKSSNNKKIRKRINTHQSIFIRRWKQHKWGANRDPKTVFLRAISKYGSEYFSGTILEKFKAESMEEIKLLLDRAEQKYIEEYNTIVPYGYNLQNGGYSPICHPETRKRMCQSKQKFLMSEDGLIWINDCSKRQTQHFQSEEGKTQAKKHGEKISQLYCDKPELLEVISNSLIEYNKTERGMEQRIKNRIHMEEFYKTEEGVKRRNELSEYAKKRWENPDYRNNQRKKGKQRFEGEEGKRKKRNLSMKVKTRCSDPKYINLLSLSMIQHYDKIGRKEYKCETCDNKKYRDKTAYDRHCKTERHKARLSGLSKEEANIKIQKETNEKISKKNKIWHTKNINPRKGKKHTEVSNEKIRIAHLGKKTSDLTNKKISASTKSSYKSGKRKHHNAKLTDEHVIYIRQKKGVITQKELACKFNVSKQTISNVQNYVTYKYVV